MKRLIAALIDVCILIGLTANAHAGNTLLDALQTKGVITEEEATTIMAEQEKER